MRSTTVTVIARRKIAISASRSSSSCKSALLASDQCKGPGNDSDPGQSNGYTLGFGETRIDSMSADPGLKESITTGATALGMALTEAETESMAVPVSYTHLRAHET